MDIQGERYYFPMFAACANDKKDAIIALLMQETKPQRDQDLTSQLKCLREIKPQRSRTPLSCAAEEGHEGIVQLLLNTGKVDPDSKGNASRTPLSYAAENGHESIVQLLLNTGNVDLDSKATGKYDASRTPLS